MDILIKNGTLITIDQARRIVVNGTIGISDGVIQKIGTTADFRGETANVEIDATNRLVLPGLINPHCHISYTLARGCGDDLPFLRWLPVVYKVEDGYTEEEWYLTSLLTIAEMIKSGTTCFADTNIFEEISSVAGAVDESGIRAVLGKHIRDTASEEQGEPGDLKRVWHREGIRSLSVTAAVEHYHHWNGKANGRLRVRLAPAVWPVCSTATYREVAEVSQSLGIGKLIHHTETPSARA